MPREIPFINQPAEKIGQGSFSDVYKLQNDPRFVVKEYNRERFEDVDSRKRVEDAQNEFAQLKKIFGEYVPDADFILAKGAHDIANLFIVQKKILGKPLDRGLIAENERAKKRFEDFITEAVRNYASRYNQETRTAPFLDIKSDNLIWGRTVDEPEAENKLYFIDTTKLFFNTALSRLRAKIMGFEEGGLDLTEAKNILGDLHSAAADSKDRAAS